MHAESGVPYNEMLFFDDCNWGDHCSGEFFCGVTLLYLHQILLNIFLTFESFSHYTDVTATFGVVSQRTPRGMQIDEFHAGLEKYKNEAKQRK